VKLNGDNLIPLHDENRPLKKPFVNYILILINLTMFLFFFLTGTLRKGIMLYGAVPINILNGKDLWTIFTSMFMHADIMHIAGNMLYLWIFGDNIEDALGHGKYLLFYLAGGVLSTFTHIASTLFSVFFSPIPYLILDLKVPSVGASGAISAVLGAYLLLYPRAKIRTLVFYFYFFTIISVPAFYYLGFWFLYQLMMGLFSLTGLPSSVAFWAHIGGFVFGAIIARGFKVTPRRRPTVPRRRPLVAPWTRTPLVDILVEDYLIRVFAFMPGVQRSDINIEAYEWEVVISAQRENIKYYGRIALPVPVIPKVMDISYMNGTLSFNLYRADQQPAWR